MTRNTALLKLVNISLMLCVSSVLMGQSRVISDFKETTEPNSSFYFYPSTLRMLNLDKDPNLDGLVRNVKKARYMIFDTARVAEPMQSFRQIEKALFSEGFEMLMEMDEKDTELTLYVIEEDGKNNGMIGLVSKPTEFAILEIMGSVDLNSFRKLMTSSFELDKITDLVEGTDFRLSRRRKKQAATNN